MLDWISQLAANMQDIQVSSLQDLVRGQRSKQPAAGNRGRQLAKHSQEMQDMHNRVLLLETTLLQERREAQQTFRKLSELQDINKRFFELNDEDKLSRFMEYMDQVQACMQN